MQDKDSTRSSINKRMNVVHNIVLSVLPWPRHVPGGSHGIVPTSKSVEKCRETLTLIWVRSYLHNSMK